MKKVWAIGWKDTLVRLYDRGALFFLLLTPLLLTLVMGEVFGGDGEEGFMPPPVAVALVNHDDGPLGEALVDIFTGYPEIREIANATEVPDEAVARAAVESGESYCCLVIVPARFSRRVISGEPAGVTVYADPTQPLGATIVEAITGQIVTQMGVRATTVSVTLEQLVRSGRVDSQSAPEEPEEMLSTTPQDGAGLHLQTLTESDDDVDFDPLAYIAPGIAMLFLSFGAAQAGQSLLAEEETGTLARLNTTPTSSAVILAGKLTGIFLLSMLQFGALMLGAVLFFGVRWGEPVAVFTLSVVLVIAFTSLGLLLAVLARSNEQASNLGTVVSLLFGLLGGSFISLNAFPAWVRQVNLVTPNAWGMQAFTKLGLGQGLEAIMPDLAGLLVLSSIMFIGGVIGYRRRVVA